MEHIFLKLWNMSISAGWVILAVLALRFLLKRAPKNITVLLWGAVGVRLLCPFSLKSAFSLLPTAQTLAPQALYQGKPELNTGIPAVNEVVNPVFTETFEVTEFGSVNPLQVVVVIAANVWLLGVIAMALYGLISYARLRRKVSAAALLKDRIWLSDHISTPFILGWIRPKIFLPSEMDGGLYEPVIAHELTHIRRGDHWIKLLGFVLLCVYWFQPLVWLAYILLCRDIELACDERVIRDMDTEQRKEYSEALLSCGIKTHRIAACPLAFGEVGVKHRIKAVLHYKKPTLWIILVAIVAAVVLIVCFLTDPKERPQDKIVDNMTIANTRPSGMAFKTDCFYAFDSNGYLYRVYCSDMTGLYEGQTIRVTYASDSKVTIEKPMPPGDWSPNYEITAIKVEYLPKQNDDVSTAYFMYDSSAMGWMPGRLPEAQYYATTVTEEERDILLKLHEGRTWQDSLVSSHLSQTQMVLNVVDEGIWNIFAICDEQFIVQGRYYALLTQKEQELIKNLKSRAVISLEAENYFTDDYLLYQQKTNQ